MLEKDIDVEKFCKDVNACMEWMKIGVQLTWVISLFAAVLSVFAIVE